MVEINRMKKVKTKQLKGLSKIVSQSSKMEGLSLSRAKKNKAVIKKLKQYGRAFSV